MTPNRRADESQDALYGDAVASRFSLLQAPTLTTSIATPAPPITVSRLRNDRPQRGRFLDSNPEDAFVFQIPLIPSADPNVRFRNGRIASSGPCKPGWCYLVDLRDGPTRRLDVPFDNVRLYLPQKTIDEFAYSRGGPRAGDLIQSGFGACDPVPFHLSQALLPVLENPALASALYVDQVALALCEHVVSRYGSSDSPLAQRSAGLASWQMRRIDEFLEADLGGNPAILDLARQCDLSASYFAEAFKKTTGISPHQWLLKRRIERAKSMLREANSTLASIAAECGFFDQSHFSRVFTRQEGCGPKEWRRRFQTR